MSHHNTQNIINNLPGQFGLNPQMNVIHNQLVPMGDQGRTEDNVTKLTHTAMPLNMQQPTMTRFPNQGFSFPPQTHQPQSPITPPANNIVTLQSSALTHAPTNQKTKKPSIPAITSNGKESKEPKEGQSVSFKTLYHKYLKKRSRSDNANVANMGASDDIEDKLEFMVQIIAVQSAKIKKMEERISHFEMMLPDYGTFDGQPHHEDDHDHEVEKDKKPQTAYQTFMQTEIPKIKQMNPDVSQKDAFKIAANNWTALKNETPTPLTPSEPQSPVSSMEPPMKRSKQE
ncbi:hypothetical protein AKO1_004343 [Acrasis kona]|uniref:HMG box domain-containing protein n=1 Tax=Acrasis kona TaxID=1008807 RepID=A0AAW2Z5P0_9EUKA